MVPAGRRRAHARGEQHRGAGDGAGQGELSPPPGAREPCVDLLTLRLCHPRGCKTLVAVLVLDFYLGSLPDRKVVFVAPTQLLCLQQEEYIKRHTRLSPPPSVAVLIGRDMDSWDATRCGKNPKLK
jgi:hypothetical protein